MKVWKIHQKITKKSASDRRQQIIDSLLSLRGLNSQKKIEQFLHPPQPKTLTPKAVGLDPKQLSKAKHRIKKAIKDQQRIIVYGDYDADGICATAILWETLHQLGANALPFIPHRQKHGYGISKSGLNEILKGNHLQSRSKPLIITVDNGIVAHSAVRYANKKGLEVIISDHHVPSRKPPQAYSLIHTTQLAGSGVAWMLAKSLIPASQLSILSSSLELAAIGSIADMVPLLSCNRAIVKHGLRKLKNSRRIGLLHLFKEAGIESENIGTYEINFIIAPRLNAMGRLGHALDSLRLLCTKSKTRALKLAQVLGSTNRDRQQLTQDQLLHARNLVGEIKNQKIIIVGHKNYHEGVIGLIAGKLVEAYWRPAIVFSQGETTSKASARSIPGFNIIQALRQVSDLLLDVGGHPMAAGFSVENKKINQLTKKLQQIAQEKLDEDSLKQSLDIDCEILLSDISWQLYHELEKFTPFGMANPRPRFSTKKVEVVEVRAVGREKKHLKLVVKNDHRSIGAIGFGLGNLAAKIRINDKLDLAYTLDQNHWNGKKDLQLKVKDIQVDKSA